MGTQSGVPPDPANAQNLLRSSGISHYWFVRQQKPAYARGGAGRSADGRCW